MKRQMIRSLLLVMALCVMPYGNECGRPAGPQLHQEPDSEVGRV